ncbi:NAD-dependent epimerase/dehydratase family protein [Brachybacterium sp. NPDC056505]|uniref:NAD-dependent epimerase/dehydratase family protein n=1 Tax=Brachybacterium sp. NPDC056505 TaxID=3345843 RepID=UPI003670FFC8
MPAQRILVTGGSGFIAGHCLLQLLEEGYRVRATMRSLEKEARVRSELEAAGLTRGEDLEFAAADLTSDDGWARALDGVDAVLHVASPVMPGHVEDEAQLVATAREGTLRVLRAARDAGVERVVLTSAFRAVSWGTPTRTGFSPRRTGRCSTAQGPTPTPARRPSPSRPPGSSPAASRMRRTS